MWWLAFLICTSWAKAYGGPQYEYVSSIQQTSDSGYIVVGKTNFYGAGKWDFLVIKINFTGELTWARTLGGLFTDDPRFVQQTHDRGYIIGGSTQSYGAGGWNGLVIKLDSTGILEWTRVFGGINDDHIHCVQQTSDSGYILAGNVELLGNPGALVVKLTSDGDISWAKTFGEINGNEMFLCVQQTLDSGYIVAGETASYGAGSFDFLVIKLTSTGKLIWARTFGGFQWEEAFSVQQTLDSGYVITGFTWSYGAGGADCLVIKLDSNGNLMWAKTFGGAMGEWATCVHQTADSGYIIGGDTGSYGPGNGELLVLKLNSDGELMWAKTVGGPNYEHSYFVSGIQQTSDSGYILTGNTYSYGAGNFDFLVAKLEPDGSMDANCPIQDCNPDTSSPAITVTVLSLDTSSISIGTPCSPETSSVSLTVTDICGGTGVEESNERLEIRDWRLQIYPNPSLGKAVIKLSSYPRQIGISALPQQAIKGASINIYDISGKLVKHILTTKQDVEINLEELSNGIYFVRVETNDYKATRKLTIIR